MNEPHEEGNMYVTDNSIDDRSLGSKGSDGIGRDWVCCRS